MYDPPPASFPSSSSTPSPAQQSHFRGMYVEVTLMFCLYFFSVLLFMMRDESQEVIECIKLQYEPIIVKETQHTSTYIHGEKH